MRNAEARERGEIQSTKLLLEIGNQLILDTKWSPAKIN